MTDLRNALDRLLLDEPPRPDTTERIVVAGRQAQRRRLAASVAGGLAGIVVIGGVVALPLTKDTGSRDAVALGTGATATSAAATPSPAGISELDPTTHECPGGKGPRITSDLGTATARGTVGEHASWLDGYVRQHLHGVLSAGFVGPSRVNGQPVANPSDSAWVIITSASHVITMEYVVKTTASGWQAHPSTFAGCPPKATNAG